MIINFYLFEAYSRFWVERGKSTAGDHIYYNSRQLVYFGLRLLVGI